MKKFIFEIDKNINLIIEESFVQEYSWDDFDVYLMIGCVKYCLRKDSLYYATLSDLKQIFVEGFLDKKVSLSKKKILSRVLFEKGDAYFNESLYINNVLMDANYLFLLPKYDGELYIEIAKMDVFNEEKQGYKLILRRKITRDTYDKWAIVFQNLQDYSEKLHKELFEK